MDLHPMWIGGQKMETPAATDIVDPATNRPFARVSAATEDHVNAAVAAARKAFHDPAWGTMDPSKRGRLLYTLAQKIRDRFDDLARTESLNVGKPLREAKGDVAYTYKLFEYYAGLADKVEGATIPVPGARLNYTLRQPLGVTVHISPWNYPLLLASRSVAPALAAGNTVVLKPASLTPLTALELGAMAKEVGFPDGVVNVITGPGTTVGRALAGHEDVDGLYFTGSVETGKELARLAANHVTPYTLELGGKNPNIVLADADLDRAVKGVHFGIFQNAGQMCWAGSRLFVEASVKDAFLKKLVARTAATKLGPGTQDGVDMGPVVSKAQEESVLGFVEKGQREGGRVLAGGGKATDPPLGDGNFVQPTIVDGVPDDSVLAREEVFGPVLSVFTFDEVDEVAARANAVRYGLYAGVWTRDLRKAHALAARLECGMVSINEYPITFPQTPFVGWKESGVGHEQGQDAIRLYTRLKNVTVNYE